VPFFKPNGDPADAWLCVYHCWHWHSCFLPPVTLLQAVFGLERAVDMTIAKRVPAIAYATTVAIRFVNNVIGERDRVPVLQQQ
jgi:hypothetical protein